MRRLTLWGTFLLLLAALYFLWQLRFERSPEFRSCHLLDLRTGTPLPPGVEWQGSDSQPRLGLRVDPAHPEVAVRLPLPITKAVDFLHVRFQVTARKLVPGRELWEDGRAMIEWYPVTGGKGWENDPICSSRYDQASEITEFIMRPDHPPGIPALRLENLGASGEFEISVFEATVVKERLIWKIGRWILMAGWIAWVVAWIGPGGKRNLPRCLLAALVWLVTGICFVVPGPWKCLQSFGSPFHLGEAPAIYQNTAPSASPIPNPPRSPEVLKSVGEIPDKGDFTLRLKHYAEHARSVLHAFMLFAPTLAMACLIGRKSACSLAVILALSIEAAQFSFGYGFDWVDIFDLGCDAAGIIIALIAHRHLTRILPRLVAS